MKKTKSNRLDSKLDKEEQAMSDAIDKALDRGKLKSIKNLKKEMH